MFYSDKIVRTQSCIQLRRIRRLHLGERHAQGARIVAEAAHGRLDRDRIHLAKERIDEIGACDLQARCLCGIAVEIVPADIMCELRRDI